MSDKDREATAYRNCSGFKLLRLQAAQASSCSGFKLLRLQAAQASSCSGFKLLRLQAAQASSCSGFKLLRLQAAQASSCSGFYNALGISSPKIKVLVQRLIFLTLFKLYATLVAPYTPFKWLWWVHDNGFVYFLNSMYLLIWLF